MTYYSAPIKAYLLVFAVPRQSMVDFLDSRPEVLNWLAYFSGSILIASRSDITALTGIIHVQYPWLQFTLSEVTSATSNGWMPGPVWDFITNPKSSGRWE